MSDDQISIEIDGQPLTARKGAMVIEVADKAGIKIPRFCYHEKLSVAAGCRMCLVDVEKAPKPLPACATPVMDGMKVFTRTSRAVEAQKSVMEFLLINHPLDCPICDQGGECELQDVAMGYGADASRFDEGKCTVEDRDIGPLIVTELTRCILCTRCVRFGEEIAGVRELGATGRGEKTRIGTFVQRSVDSELSGNVIDICPVGALTSKPFRYQARAWELMQRDSIAPHDVVGSNVHVHVHPGIGRVMRVVPRRNEEVNEVWISDRDRFSYTGLYAEDRLASPMVKRDGKWLATDWETALAETATSIRAVISEKGPQATAALAGPISTVEEAFLLQGLVRGLGGRNVDHRLRETDFVDQDKMSVAPGLGLELAEFERAEDILLVGANTRTDAPLLNHRIRKAALAGARVMSISAVTMDANFPLHGKIKAGPADLLDQLLAVAKASGVDLKDSPDLAARAKGMKVSAAQKAIHKSLSLSERSVVLLGEGANHHPQAGAIRAVAAAIARQCDAHLGLLTSGPNAAGAWAAGAVPHRGPGGRAIDKPGLSAAQMFATGLDAYLLLNLEPELDCAAGAGCLRSLNAARFVACITPFVTDAMREYASVLLPQAPFTETSGTFVNGEGRWQSFGGTLAPFEQSRPGWKILRVLGNQLDLDGFSYTTSKEVLADLRATLPPADEQKPLRECLDLAVAVSPMTDTGIARIGQRTIYAQDNLVRRAQPLQNTRSALQGRQIRICRALAKKIGVTEGDSASVESAGGRVSMVVALDDAVAEGSAVVPAGTAGTAALGADFSILEITPV